MGEDMIQTDLRRPAEVFPPGDFIQEELEARDWKQADLADILDRPRAVISGLINGQRRITEDTARGLSEAFGTSAQYWLNLELAYRLHLSEQARPTETEIAQRARLYDTFPVRQMIARSWIEPSSNVDVLETRLCEYYSISKASDTPALTHAARKSVQAVKNPLQQAWLFRVRQLAEKLPAARYSQSKLKKAFVQLRQLVQDPEEARHVPKVLNEAGVRFVVVEQLPSSKLDGACFWLDKVSPVVGLTMRFDRIDNFWFTLIHELKHVENGHGYACPVVDDDLPGARSNEGGESEEEVLVNQQATDFLIPREQLEEFIARIRPMYSQKQIVAFAQRVGVHPGIVVGQLHLRNEISYSHHRRFLQNIRGIVTSAARCDGWGVVPSDNKEVS